MSFASGSVSRNLLRRWKSVPLPGLTQGSTLSITSTLSDTSSLPLRVVVRPEWRDSGQIELVVREGERSRRRGQRDVAGRGKASSEPLSEIEMTVTREADVRTSLGRLEPHYSIRLTDAASAPACSFDSFESTSSDSSEGPPQHYHHRHLFASKAIRKVILDDGSVHPDSSEYSDPLLPDGMKRVEYHDGLAHITHHESSVAQLVPQSDDVYESGGDDEDFAPSAATDQQDPIESPSTADDDELAVTTVLTVRVPEKLNLSCDLQRMSGSEVTGGGGSISVRGKLEGSVSLRTCRGGSISVTKLRGHTIELVSSTSAASDGDGNPLDNSSDCPVIYCKELIEAESLTVSTTGRVRAKQIHGRSVNIQVNHQRRSQPLHNEQNTSARTEPLETDSDDEGSLVDVSALFVSGAGGGGSASIRVTAAGPDDRPSPTLGRRAVRVKSHHGALEVVATRLSQPTDVDPYTHERYPLVELGGANGSFEVTIYGTEPSRAHAESSSAPSRSDEDWTSCRVHVDSLLPESVSMITANRGDVSLTLDRKTEADLRLASTPGSPSLLETAAMLAEQEDSDLLLRVLSHLPRDSTERTANDGSRPRISIDTKSYTCTGRTLESDEGAVVYREGYVENASHEPDSRFDRKSRGEGKIRLDGAEAQALKGFARQQPSLDNNSSSSCSSRDDRASIKDTGTRPLIAVASGGRITVETVSWIGAIARRYGLDDRNHGIGRTASRSGRSIAPQ